MVFLHIHPKTDDDSCFNSFEPGNLVVSVHTAHFDMHLVRTEAESGLHSAHGVVYVDDLQLTHLHGWLHYLQKTPTYRGKKLSDESIHSYGQSLRAFCHWLEREELLHKPITTRFRLPRVEEKFKPTFTPEDIQKLLDACEEGDWNKPQLRKTLTARNRAIDTPAH